MEKLKVLSKGFRGKVIADAKKQKRHQAYITQQTVNCDFHKNIICWKQSFNKPFDCQVCTNLKE